MEPRIYTAGELVESVLEDAKKQAKRMHIDGDCVLLDCAGYEYAVELSRIPDAAGLFGWVLHLAEKTWMTKRDIEHFILIVAAKNHIQINRNT